MTASTVAASSSSVKARLSGSQRGTTHCHVGVSHVGGFGDENVTREQKKPWGLQLVLAVVSHSHAQE